MVRYRDTKTDDMNRKKKHTKHLSGRIIKASDNGLVVLSYWNNWLSCTEYIYLPSASTS